MANDLAETYMEREFWIALRDLLMPSGTPPYPGRTKLALKKIKQKVKSLPVEITSFPQRRTFDAIFEFRRGVCTDYSDPGYNFPDLWKYMSALSKFPKWYSDSAMTIRPLVT